VANLLINAVEAASAVVGLSWVLEKECLLIEVRNDGEEIPAWIQERLFEYRETFGKPGGQGLGLAFAKKVVEGHGGDIGYGRDHEVTVFRMTLPYVVARCDAASAASDEPVSTDGDRQHAEGRILVCLSNTQMQKDLADIRETQPWGKESQTSEVLTVLLLTSRTCLNTLRPIR
jgi:hypothetical protein